jgi:hypothetical protein
VVHPGLHHTERRRRRRGWERGAGCSAAAAVAVVDPTQNAVVRRLATRSVHFLSLLSMMNRTSTSFDDDNDGRMGGNDDGRGVDAKNVNKRGTVEDKEGAGVAGGTSMDEGRQLLPPRATVRDVSSYAL